MGVSRRNHHLVDGDSTLLARSLLGVVYQCLCHHASVNHGQRNRGSAIIENNTADEQAILDLGGLCFEKPASNNRPFAGRRNIYGDGAGSKPFQRGGFEFGSGSVLREAKGCRCDANGE